MNATPNGARPFYTREGEAFVPTGLGKSPWDRTTQNGVALGLVMSHTLHEAADAAHAHVARFTLDILRPTPLAPTRVIWKPLHEGRRIRLMQGELEAGGIIGARANALILAPSPPFPAPLPASPPAVDPTQAPAEQVIPRSLGMETRLVQRGRASLETPRAPHRLWLRIEAELTPGVKASPFSTAVALADFGASSIGPAGAGWNSPNVDIAVHFARAPRGEWMHTEAEPMMLGAGIGLIDHRLSDLEGPFGRAHQILFFSRQRANAA